MKAVHKVVILCGAAGVCVSLLGSRHWNFDAGAHEAASLAIELGLMPSALAAAGFIPEDAQTLLERLASAPELQARLAEAKDASAHAVARLTQLANDLVARPSNGELRDAHAAAILSVEESSDRVAAARRELMAVALSDAPYDRKALLDRCRLARGCRIDEAFGVLPHAPSDLDAIEEDLNAESRSVRLGTALDPQAARRLATLRANPEVTQAQQRVAMNQRAIEDLFDQN